MMTVSGSNILLTGSVGFLGKHLYNHLSVNNNVMRYAHDVRDFEKIKQENFPELNIIIHLASPTDYIDLEDTNRTVTSIVDGTLNMLRLAKKHKSKFVYASTLAVEFEKNTTYHYANCKLAMENYITSTYDDYIILRIPRVYDRSKVKGLMRRLRAGIVPVEDFTNQVHYLTVDLFIKQTVAGICKRNCTIEYNGLKTSSIAHIKRIFVD